MGYNNPTVIELKNLKSLKSLQLDTSGDENLLTAVFSLEPQDNLPVVETPLVGPHDDQLTKPVIESSPTIMALSDDTGYHLRLFTAEEVLPTITEKPVASKRGKSQFALPSTSNDDINKTEDTGKPSEN